MNEIVSFDEAVEWLDELSQIPADEIDSSLRQSAEEIRELARNVELADWNTDVELDADELFAAVIKGANLSRTAFLDDNQSVEPLVSLAADMSEKFAVLLDVDDDLDVCDDWLDDELSRGDSLDEEIVAPSAAEIGAILNTLQAAAPVETEHDTEESTVEVSDAAPPRREDKPEAVDELGNMSADIRDAFLDDAGRCLAQIEKSLLSLEENPQDKEQLHIVGRELHTIKGASATIGFGTLASYIHDVEDSVRALSSNDQNPDLGELLSYLDAIRQRVDQFKGSEPSERQEDSAAMHFDPLALNSEDAIESAASAKIDFDAGASDDETVRIKSSSLNRMMDMLSELVMMRNQRDTELSTLVGIHEAMVESVARLRTVNYEGGEASGERGFGNDHTSRIDSGTQLNQIASDLVELAHGLRECYQPVAEGNHAVSQFIRGFRQELVGLRRTPIEGLFRRLRRAVSDAARAESKKVNLVLKGEGTGIERSLQARLFEPLLHVVRNAVSHGIENPEDRVASGKSEQGEITLVAFSGPDLLSIEVQDDGKGLDYDAIRRRGVERGLIDANTAISRAELAQLIFHPGFSTRDVTTQISGRGVGMDVVASALERMRGWVEIDSTVGKGSVIRLSVPLPSMIQHAMIFRAAGQLFAIPMQSVQSAGQPDPTLNPICVNQLMQLGGGVGNQREMITLGALSAKSGRESDSRCAILVDEIIGPEEVVVRPLPRLLKQHPICSGATLSGLGEAVLLLDAKRLMESSLSFSQAIPDKPEAAPLMLVVDDSKTSRMRVVRSLKRHGYQTIECQDGAKAWETIQRTKFSAVFSDIEMPRLDGFGLLEKIKADSSFDHLPVVLISSRTEDEYQNRASELGAIECLPKPLDDDSLDRVLSRNEFKPFRNKNFSSVLG